MKQTFAIWLFLAFGALSVTAQSLTFEHWTDYKRGVSDPNEWYAASLQNNSLGLVRPSDVRRQGDVVEYWVKNIYALGGEPFAMQKLEINCRTQTYKLLYVVMYWEWTSEGGEIRLIKKHPSPQSYDVSTLPSKPVVPDTAGESEMKAVCTAFSSNTHTNAAKPTSKRRSKRK